MGRLKSHLFHLLFACQLLLLAMVTSTDVDPDSELHSIPKSNYLPTFRVLGSVEGNWYFVETEKRMTRHEAAVYCGSYGLKLASVENQVRYEFVQEALGSLGLTRSKIIIFYPTFQLSGNLIGSDFWTSGIESKLPSMFVWNGTEVELSNLVIPRWNYNNLSNYYCVSLFRWTDTDHGLSAHECKRDQFHPICQD